MFATLAGAYPAPPMDDPRAFDLKAALKAVIADQLEAGLGLLSDGSVGWADPLEAVWRGLVHDPGASPHRSAPLTVDIWTSAQALAGDAVVKQSLPGPYSLGRRFAAGRSPGSHGDPTLALADELAGELVDLTLAGCPFIQIDEDAAVDIGPDEAERRLFREAHERLLAGLAPLGSRPHLSLAIRGGNADLAGAETIFGPAYDSHLFDLIAGPDNWRLATRAPLERGLILGVVDARTAKLDDPEVVVWAIGYATSSGRGEDRIGISPSGSLAGLGVPAARAKIGLLGTVVGLIERRHDEPIAASLDPRAIDARSAALGEWQPRRGRRHRDG